MSHHTYERVSPRVPDRRPGKPIFAHLRAVGTTITLCMCPGTSIWVAADPDAELCSKCARAAERRNLAVQLALDGLEPAPPPFNRADYAR